MRIPYFKVESVLSGQVTFDVLQTRLRDFVNARIQNGEYTERGLARILDISQSQLHNVLKGARTLHLALADRLLIKFGITALDLLCEHEMQDALRLLASPDNRYVPAQIARKPAGRSEQIASQRTERAR
ncbi:MAG TPA: hypothetical protein VGL97_04415 [Bryobacteraceae bacterium]|jgi:plasmid maintenance system antidote protein VapI